MVTTRDTNETLTPLEQIERLVQTAVGRYPTATQRLEHKVGRLYQTLDRLSPLEQRSHEARELRAEAWRALAELRRRRIIAACREHGIRGVKVIPTDVFERLVPIGGRDTSLDERPADGVLVAAPLYASAITVRWWDKHRGTLEATAYLPAVRPAALADRQQRIVQIAREFEHNATELIVFPATWSEPVRVLDDPVAVVAGWHTPPQWLTQHRAHGEHLPTCTTYLLAGRYGPATASEAALTEQAR